MTTSCINTIICTVIVGIVATTQTYCFETPGHDVIEACAYRYLLESTTANRKPLLDTFGVTVSGKEVLDYLIAKGILEKPKCYGSNTGDCSDPNNGNAVDWLPVLGSGDEDLIMSRQFSGTGQQTHFMATGWDVLDDPTIDPLIDAPANLFYRAYPRVLRYIEDNIILITSKDALLSNKKRAMYSIMHAIGDSYSDGHVVRDTSTWEIYYLKPYAPIVGHLYLFDSAAKSLRKNSKYHHQSVEVGDTEFMKFMEVNLQLPYSVADTLLTSRGIQARNSLVGLLLIVYKIMTEQQNNPNTEKHRNNWIHYCKIFLAPAYHKDIIKTTRPNRYQTVDVEWMPKVTIGGFFRDRGENGSSKGIRIGYRTDSKTLAPFDFSMLLDYDWYKKDGVNKATLGIHAIPLNIQFTSDFSYCIDAFVIDIPLQKDGGEVDFYTSLLNLSINTSRFPFLNYCGLEFGKYSWIKNSLQPDLKLLLGLSINKDPFDWIGLETVTELEGNNWKIPNTRPKVQPRTYSTYSYLITSQFAPLRKEGNSFVSFLAGYGFYRDINQQTGLLLHDVYYGGDFIGKINYSIDKLSDDDLKFMTIATEIAPAIRYRIADYFYYSFRLPFSIGVSLSFPSKTNTIATLYTDIGGSFGVGVNHGGVEILMEPLRVVYEFNKEIVYWSPTCRIGYRTPNLF